MNGQGDSAGLIYGLSFHYIDHLAPLCEIMKVPLLVTEEEMQKTIFAFYPKLQVIHINYIHLPEYVVSNYKLLFICTPRVLFDEVFFFSQMMHRKKVHTIWCPHGNSDKGHKVPYMQGLGQEEALFVYGQKMVDFLQSKGVLLENKSYLMVGNYRKEHYLQNQEFYDSLVRAVLSNKIDKRKKTIFYAPTWDDAEKSSSFQGALPSLIDSLCGEFNLLIKPHPNLLIDSAIENRRLIERYEKKEGVFFLLEFPPIYPLLAAIDIYIGDFSSIGYDVLSFQKPMFFLNGQKREVQKDQGLYLYRCGIEVQQEDYVKMLSILHKELPVDQMLFSDIRKEVYEYTFVEQKDLKEKIETFCIPFLTDELPFF